VIGDDNDPTFRYVFDPVDLCAEIEAMKHSEEPSRRFHGARIDTTRFARIPLAQSKDATREVFAQPAPIQLTGHRLEPLAKGSTLGIDWRRRRIASGCQLNRLHHSD
jgi:hypothetical protein